jgi:hypothetical protein
MSHARSRSILVVALWTAALAGCSSPTGSTPSPTAGAAAAPTPSTSPARPTSTPGPVAIPDGVYATGPRSVADIRAEIAASKLTEGEQKVIVNELFELGDSKTMTISIELRKGQWTQRQQLDDGPNGVGSRATYAFPDDHTVVIQEACCGISSFAVDRDGDTFRLTYSSDNPSSAVDQLAAHILFEEAPFTLVP